MVLNTSLFFTMTVVIECHVIGIAVESRFVLSYLHITEDIPSLQTTRNTFSRGLDM